MMMLEFGRIFLSFLVFVNYWEHKNIDVHRRKCEKFIARMQEVVVPTP